MQVRGRCRLRTVRRLGGKESVAEEEDGDEDEGEDGDAGEGEDSRRGRRGSHGGDDGLGLQAFAQEEEEEEVNESGSPSGYEREGKRDGGRDGNMESVERKLITV